MSTEDLHEVVRRSADARMHARTELERRRAGDDLLAALDELERRGGGASHPRPRESVARG